MATVHKYEWNISTDIKNNVWTSKLLCSYVVLSIWELGVKQHHMMSTGKEHISLPGYKTATIQTVPNFVPAALQVLQ